MAKTQEAKNKRLLLVIARTAAQARTGGLRRSRPCSATGKDACVAMRPDARRLTLLPSVARTAPSPGR
jgi:hypothetical protein